MNKNNLDNIEILIDEDDNLIIDFNIVDISFDIPDFDEPDFEN